MLVDQKFNKRSAQKVPCNYANFAWKAYEDTSHQFALTFYGNDEGTLIVRMNALEAHRFIEQINGELAKHAKFLIAKGATP